jgi:hypothetical protein
MNGHDCFFKLCDSHDWATGACAVEWENEAERNEKYGAGVMRCTAAVGGLGVELILVLIAVGALYVAGGILVGRYRGDTGARASAGSGRLLGPTLGAHPHAANWVALGGLVADGVSFVAGRRSQPSNARAVAGAELDGGRSAPLLHGNAGAKEAKRHRHKKKEGTSAVAVESASARALQRSGSEEVGEASERSVPPSGSKSQAKSQKSVVGTNIAQSDTAQGTARGRWVHVPT